MDEIVFISGNKYKVEQLAKYLGFSVKQMELNVPEIQSPTLDPIEVVTAKAKLAYEVVGNTVLVEDTAIRFKALGKLPGPYFKAFLQELGPEGLCKILKRFDSRDAEVITQFALCDTEGVQLFSAQMDCTVAKRPRGESGIGADSILIPVGWDKTWDEMTKEEQEQSSVRLQAITKLRKYLHKTS